MATIPPGFRPVNEQRRVQFDFAPGTPQSVIDATRAYAEHDAQQAQEPEGVEIPEGFQLLGPGIGKSSPEPSPSQAEITELVRAGQPANPLENFLTGNAYGIGGTAVGALQLASRLPASGQPDYLFADLPQGPNSAEAADALARDFEARRAASPAMQTRAGSFGEFTGGMAATAPLAYASVPAKGANVLSWLTRGAVGGGIAAGTQPVTGENFGQEKVRQMGTGAAFGAGVPAAGRGIMSLAERTFAPNAMAQFANVANKSANAKPFAREGEELAERTGVRMTPGQVSGSKVQTSLENMTRQSIFSADKAFEADQRIAGDVIRYVDRIMDNVTRNPASEAVIGTQIQAATRGGVAKIAAKRESQAAADYGQLDKMLGGRKFVVPTNAIREADAIIAEYGAVASPEAARIVRQAEALKAQLAGKKAYTFTEAQKSRSYYGRGARGAANVFDEVNPDINRRIATRIFKAFSADIEASADNLSGRGPGLVPAGTVGLSDAIKQANGNYRRYSELLEAMESHPIARLFGDHVKLDDVLEFDKIAPEVVIDRLGKMKPSELKMVRGFLETQAPDAWQQYKRLLIEKAMDSARTLPTSMGANTVPFNASQFVRALGADKPDRIKQLEQVFGPSELRELDDAFRVARRLGDHFGRNSSNTAAWAQADNFFQSLRTLSAKGIASSAGEVMGLRKVANVMMNADGRRALMQLSRLPPGSRQAASLMGVISALASGQSAERSDNQRNSN